MPRVLVGVAVVDVVPVPVVGVVDMGKQQDLD